MLAPLSFASISPNRWQVRLLNASRLSFQNLVLIVPYLDFADALAEASYAFVLYAFSNIADQKSSFA